MKVAIMQPYFFPYLGYFRLFTKIDLFVIYDCVQFPRRGWVHRNRICIGERQEWVTMPVQKCPQSTRICDLEFQSDTDSWFNSVSYKLLGVAKKHGLESQLDTSILKPSGSVVDYIEKTLEWSCNALDISPKLVRSSKFNVDPAIKAQDRILEVCRRTKATQYFNLSGGVELYDSNDFGNAGIHLEFLPEFEGGYESLLGRILKEPIGKIKQDLYK